MALRSVRRFLVCWALISSALLRQAGADEQPCAKGEVERVLNANPSERMQIVTAILESNTMCGWCIVPCNARPGGALNPPVWTDPTAATVFALRLPPPVRADVTVAQVSTKFYACTPAFTSARTVVAWPMPAQRLSSLISGIATRSSSSSAAWQPTVR